MEKLGRIFGNSKNYSYISSMSKTKRWIEQQMESGVDVLHPEYQHSDDDYLYQEYISKNAENDN